MSDQESEVTSVAPIVLFVYNRPWHVRQTIEALQLNELASESRLIIYSDAPRDVNAAEGVAAVREYIHSLDGFSSVEIVEMKRNRRLAPLLIEQLPEVLSRHGRAIVLEDDIVTSPFFLRYMNDALEKYADDDRVISIHGYCYPVDGLPDAFFLKGADCWGWATWERGWSLFEQDGSRLMEALRIRDLLDRFDFFGSGYFSSLLQQQIDGVVDAWDVRWYASALLHDKLTLYAGKPLVKNIGFDGSGIHCGNDSTFDVELHARPIDISNVLVEESHEALMAFSRFFRQVSHPGLVTRIVRKLRRMMK